MRISRGGNNYTVRSSLLKHLTYIGKYRDRLVNWLAREAHLRLDNRGEGDQALLLIALGVALTDEAIPYDCEPSQPKNLIARFELIFCFLLEPKK